MVKYCCICKVEYGIIDDVSFHRIPSNEEIKNKWLAIIGRQVSKHSTVCSQHFSDEDFLYKVVGDGVQRYLKPTALPSLTKFSSKKLASKSDLISEENLNVFKQEDLETAQIPIIHSCKETHSKYVSDVTDVDESDCVSHDKTKSLNTENVQHNAESEKMIEDKNLKSFIQEDLGTSQILIVHSCKETHSNYVNNMTDVDESDCVSHDETDISNIENVQHNVKSEKMMEDKNLERSLNEPHDGRKRNHRLRYIGDLQREDFTSNFSWNIVKSYREKTKQKHKILNQKVQRLSKRVEYLQSLLNPLHKRDNKKLQDNTTSSKYKKNSVDSKSKISVNFITDHDYI